MYGTKDLIKKTEKVYGVYSHPWGIVFNQKNINIRKTTLKKLPFFKKLNNNSKILEIGGTGQDAVAWQQLGFNTTFIEISRENCRKTLLHTKENIKVINADFLRYKFNTKFDVVRSRGVIHHLSKPGLALKKVHSLLVLRGFFHFNLYRSGIFYYYFVEKLREISKTFNLKLFNKIVIKTKIKKKDYLKIDNQTIKSENRFYSLILDDMFVPICNPANYFDVLKDLKNLGFKIIKQNKIKKHLNHDLLYPDFPLKKNHIVFDVQKRKNKINKNLKLKYKIPKNIETKITNKIPFMKKTNNIFKIFYSLNSKYKWHKNSRFIRDFITLYKDCCLFSLTKMSPSDKHFILQNRLMYIIKKNLRN